MIRVLVCGGRFFRGRKLLDRTLDMILEANKRLVIIHGACGDDADCLKGADVYAGADGLTHQWAVEHNIITFAEPAHWTSQGNAAGPQRNARMLSLHRPQLVVAFPGSAGTKDMISKAQRLRIPIIRPTY